MAHIYPEPPAPRHFWRRLLALAVDLMLAGLIATLVMWPLLRENTDRIRIAMPGFRLSVCQDGTFITPQMAEYLQRDRVLAVRYCRDRAWWVENGYRAELLLERERKGNVTRSLTANVPVDSQGRPVAPVTPDPIIALFLLIAGGAFCLVRWGGATPGKRLLGLRVVLPGPGSALRRETVKFLPLAMLVTAGTLLPPGLYMPPGPVGPALIWVTVLAFLFWYYLLPFFTGERRARWDRWAGSRVERPGSRG